MQCLIDCYLLPEKRACIFTAAEGFHVLFLFITLTTYRPHECLDFVTYPLPSFVSHSFITKYQSGSMVQSLKWFTSISTPSDSAKQKRRLFHDRIPTFAFRSKRIREDHVKHTWHVPSIHHSFITQNMKKNFFSLLTNGQRTHRHTNDKADAVAAIKVRYL